MCSVNLNSIVNQELQLGDTKNRIEKKVRSLAFNASVTSPGLLDSPGKLMHHMPDALKDVKKYTIGRHRLYYLGHHSDCSYDVIFIKWFKKDDKNREVSKAFQEKLISALRLPTERVLRKDTSANS